MGNKGLKRDNKGERAQVFSVNKAIPEARTNAAQSLKTMTGLAAHQFMIFSDVFDVIKRIPFTVITSPIIPTILAVNPEALNTLPISIKPKTMTNPNTAHLMLRFIFFLRRFFNISGFNSHNMPNNIQIMPIIFDRIIKSLLKKLY